MKIALQNQPYKFISENTEICGGDTAFLETKLNSRYRDTLASGVVTITPSECYEILELNRIKVIGITGTNGKTTTASAIYSLLLDLGYKCAMQGTRGFFMNDEMIESKSLTTPTLLNTYSHMLQAIESGCEFFVMEVSSHAIEQERIAAIEFELKILTNITQDHLDYHKNIDEYMRVKNSFFSDECKKLINKDEPRANFNIKNTYTYAIENPASYRIDAYSLNDGVSGLLNHFGEVVPFASSLHGFFNLYNLSCAMAAVHMLTQKPLPEIADVLENFGGVSGRMEVVSDEPLVIVDFAHTPDGFMQVLNALKEKELLVVFGAGGDRDKSKRPIMAQIAESYAKKLYITSDNPRFEDPDTIIEDILAGLKEPNRAFVDVNRRSAIERALSEQHGDEVVIILGKGDETTQIIYDQHMPFDDRVVVREVLQNR